MSHDMWHVTSHVRSHFMLHVKSHVTSCHISWKVSCHISSHLTCHMTCDMSNDMWHHMSCHTSCLITMAPSLCTSLWQLPISLLGCSYQALSYSSQLVLSYYTWRNRGPWALLVLCSIIIQCSALMTPNNINRPRRHGTLPSDIWRWPIVKNDKIYSLKWFWHTAAPTPQTWPSG